MLIQTAAISAQELLPEKELMLPFSALIFTVDQTGIFYLIDSKTNEIVSVGDGGQELKRGFGIGLNPADLRDPDAIVFRGMTLYILDRASKSVKTYDRMLNFRGEFKLEEMFPDKRINNPSAMWVDHFGQIYIADDKNNQVFLFDQFFRPRTDIEFPDNLKFRIQSPYQVMVNETHIALLDTVYLHVFDSFFNPVSTIKTQFKNANIGFYKNLFCLYTAGKLLCYQNNDSEIMEFNFKIPVKDSMAFAQFLIYNDSAIILQDSILYFYNLDKILNVK